MAAITVSTVAPVAVQKGYIPIIARTRATKGKTIPANQRVRAIEVTEFDVSGLPSKWVEFARVSLNRIAVAQLQELWNSQGDNLKSTDSALWKTDALLAYAAREADSKRLTGENILAACEAFIATINPAAKETATHILASMAAPVKKGNEKQLFSLSAKLAAFIQSQEDSSDGEGEEVHPILTSVLAKMTDRANELKEQRESFEQPAEAF